MLRRGLHGELIGFDKKTGRPLYAAAGLSGPDGIGSYSDLSTDFYKTFQPDNWQHAGSEGWMDANVPGWGNNPNLQMFARRGVGSDASGGSMASLGVLLGLGAVLYLVLKN